MTKARKRIVYVVGAGLSAGLGFPTIRTLLPEMWKILERSGLDKDLSKIIRFHHPDFNPALSNTFPNIEELLSEMQANEELFKSSRPATGTFTAEDLLRHRQSLLLELAHWFHDIKKKALKKRPTWLLELIDRIREERAQVVSFNWDLVLDELLFGSKLDRTSYGLGKSTAPCLLKPHGSLNWYEASTGKYLKADKKLKLAGRGAGEVYAFRPYRAPNSSRREYMPLIVPPVYAKQFRGAVFEHLWQQVVAALSVASEVRFLGYSLAPADFHARFILRCGFHNQEEGALMDDGNRASPTGRARVVIVDPCEDGEAPRRIERCVGWRCKWTKQTIQDWVES